MNKINSERILNLNIKNNEDINIINVKNIEINKNKLSLVTNLSKENKFYFKINKIIYNNKKFKSNHIFKYHDPNLNIKIGKINYFLTCYNRETIEHYNILIVYNEIIINDEFIVQNLRNESKIMEAKNLIGRSFEFEVEIYKFINIFIK